MEIIPNQPSNAIDRSSVFYRSQHDRYPTIVKGDGNYLWDSHGNKFLDFTSGFSATTSIGQGREEIADAIAAQARKLAFVHNSRVTNEPQEALAEKLVALAPDGVDRVMFTSIESEANELSFRIARQFHLSRGEKARWKILSLKQSYHGATMAALSATGRTDINADYAPYLYEVPRADPPVLFRGRFSSLTREEAGEAAATAFEEALIKADPSTVSAFIADPISVSPGMAVPPLDYWRRGRDICNEHGILLIADEIVTGTGRSGKFLCLDHFGISADLTNLAKGLAGGYASLGATLVNKRVAETIEVGRRRMAEVHNHSGNPLACATGLAVLDVIENEKLVSNAEKMGEYLKELLTETFSDCNLIGDFRGLGLMQAIEYKQPESDREPLPESIGMIENLNRELWNAGVLLNNIAFRSPLVSDCTMFVPSLAVTADLLEIGVGALQESLHKLFPPNSQQITKD